MTKFIIRDGNKLFLKERTHIDNMFLGNSFRETDLRTELKPDSIKKIFENPITAIAYDTTHNQHNIEMDKKSLTKALDFWINDKVLQNEKILFLEGKLDDVHEIELKNLIELREFVQKQDNDTVFTRFRESDGGKKYDFTKKSSWGVEFFVKKELVPNNITYSYRGLFIGDGTRWDFGSLMTNDEISGVLGGGRHNTPGGGDWTTAFSTAANHVGEALNELSRELSRSNGAGTDTSPQTNRRSSTADMNPNNWTVERMGTNPRRWCVVDRQSRMIATDFHSQGTAQSYIREHKDMRDGIFTLPPSGTETQMVGLAGESLRAGDLIFRNEINRQWYRVMPHTNHNMPVMVAARDFRHGEMVEAVRQGSFNVTAFPPSSIGRDTLFTATLVMADRTQNIRTTRRGLEYLQNKILQSARMVFNNMRVDTTNIEISQSVTTTISFIGEDGIRLTLILLHTRNRMNTLIDDPNAMDVELLGDHEVRIDGDEYRLSEISNAVTLIYDHSNQEMRLRMEPQHPELPTVQAPPPPSNNRIQDITFENLTIHTVSETLEAGENSYTTVTYAAQNGQYEITFDLYVTGREIDRINEGFRTHTLRIIEGEEEGRDNRIEIDGERYYCINYTIRQRIQLDIDREKRFTNMYLKEIGSRARAIAQEHPLVYELTFENPEDGVEMEMGIIRSTTAFENPSDGGRVFNDIIMELRNGGLHNIRILPGPENLIQIGRYRFRLDGQSVRVTWSSR